MPILTEVFKIKMSSIVDLVRAFSIIEMLGLLTFFRLVYYVLNIVLDAIGDFLLGPHPRKVVVPMFEEQQHDILKDRPKFDPEKLRGETQVVYQWDPSTMDYFGEIPAMSKAQVENIVMKAKKAQSKWKHSSFRTRKLLMRTMLRYITENQDACARVAVRESGKTFLDALIGEVLVTCEKLV